MARETYQPRHAADRCDARDGVTQLRCDLSAEHGYCHAARETHEVWLEWFGSARGHRSVRVPA